MKCLFIGGCERSGTTHLASLFSGFVGTVVTPESPFKYLFFTVSTVPELRLKLSSNFYFRSWGVEPSAINCLGLRGLEELVNEYSKKNGINNWEWWIDHSPRNFERIDLWELEIKPVCYIHIVRDGRAVCSSLKRVMWGVKNPVLAAEWWNRSVSLGLACGSVLGPDKFVTIKYEDLLSDQDTVIERLLRFSGIPNRLNALKSYNVPRFSQSQHGLVGKGADRTRVDAWKRDLGEREAALFCRYSSSLLVLLGYVEAVDHRVTETRIDKWRRMLVAGVLAKIVTRFRLFLRSSSKGNAK